MGDDRTRLLRQPGLVHAADDEAGRLGRGGEDPVGGDDAGAADPGEVDAVLAVDGGIAGHGQRRPPAGSAAPAVVVAAAWPCAVGRAFGVSVTNDGQSPSRHV